MTDTNMRPIRTRPIPTTTRPHRRHSRDPGRHPNREPRLRGRCRQAAAPDGALGLFRQGRLPARADLQRRRRLRAAALRGDRRPRPARRRSQAAHHHRGSTPTSGELAVEDNGIGMSRDELVEALGTIARSGTKAFMERLEAAQGRRGRHADRPVRRRLLLGLHGGRPRRRRLPPRRRGRGLALVVGRQGHLHGRRRPPLDDAPARGTRVVLHLMEDAKSYTERFNARAHRQGAVRPRAGADRDRREARRRARRDRRRRGALDQAALRDQARGIHRLLPQRRRPVRRAGADDPLPRRGPARVSPRSPSCRARGRSTCSTPTARAA